MPDSSDLILKRKSEHLDLCLTDSVSFKNKSNGFEHYEFKHHATTQVDISKIDFTTEFFNKKISYPFLISCMTGGIEKADNINLKLAESAASLNIPLGLGSLRYALENNEHDSRLKEIRINAKSIPILANLGIAQIIQQKKISSLQRVIDLLEADVMVIHLNPLQELMQENGEPNFPSLLKSIKNIVKKINLPVIVKEVGAGISKNVAKELLDIGVKGIDVAGAGGTSWAGVEILRSKSTQSEMFWDWGLPTSYCIRKVASLKKKYDFILVGSGGIDTPFDLAKSLALGADMCGSARTILKTLNSNGDEGVATLIKHWFEIVKKIMFLTGSHSLDELNRRKLVRSKELF
ncbi:MAG: type 2 isopentenyl-diphosphate Delta-isomerase [Ignavibacteria bacterium]|jgi:isopentenyl-diphosphate delta-isomerase|nr:type 2 isopentenyl-diphosphate Delta-isomerase [Ignavibacteria bacterium]